jgi:predicted PurR-regulated permease PerM
LAIVASGPGGDLEFWRRNMNEAASAEQPSPAAGGRPSTGQIVRSTALRTVTVLLVLLVAYGIYVVRNILVLVLIALFLAVSLDPPVRWLMAKGLRRSLAVAVVIGLALIFLVIFIWSVVPPIARQAAKLSADLPGYLGRLSVESKGIRAITDRYHLTERLSSIVADLPGRLASGAVGSVVKIAGTLAAVGTVAVLTIYFMAALPNIRANVVQLYPPHRRSRVAHALDVVVDKVGGYMIGNIVISLFAGTATFICLQVVGVPFALPLAIAVAVADLIPTIGATLGAVICLVVSLLTVGIWPQSIIVLLFFIAYQQIENYFLAPRVLRNTVDMPAVAVLLAALIGGSLLGLVGAVMAIPAAAAVKVFLSPKVAATQTLPRKQTES